MNFGIKILIFFSLFSNENFNYGLSQALMPEINSFNPYIDIPFSFQDTIVFHVGEKVLFSQLCREDIPQDISTLSLGFKKLLINKKAYRSIVYFEDTLITKAIYYHKGSDKSKVFQLFGLSESDFTKIKRKQYYHTRIQENILINCWYNRKSFFYQEELIIIE